MDKRYVSLFPGNTPRYLNNSIFDSKKKDDWNAICIALKRFLKKKNIEINTYDIQTKDAPFKYIFFDLPYLWNIRNVPVWKQIWSHRGKNILFCNETPIVIPYNFFKLFHVFFAKIYTWNDEWVDNNKYFKLRLPQQSVGIYTKRKQFKRKKFLVLINANKSAFFPFTLISPFGKELYSERIKAIEFFEETIPNEFSLYGRGWNKSKKYSLRELLFGYRKYKTYKGEIPIGKKIELLSHFKFCVCFENITNVEGFITEKIFDCFMAKCIPIYLGAANVQEYIPKNCFIDFRDFNCDYEKLLRFLRTVDENTYNSYIKNMEQLLANKRFRQVWFEEGFFKFFLEDVLDMNQI